MPDNSIKKGQEEKEDKKKSFFKKILILTFLLFLALFCLRVYKIFKDFPTIKQSDNRINFLFLGISGGEYKPPDLTDTIIFSSYNINNGRLLFLSIPRDIWLESLKAKINTTYHYGGFPLAKKAVEEIVGQPVHYFFVLDFEGFKKMVNILGGVNIKVERTFDDFKYPIPGKENDDCNGDKEFKCRYEHLHFEAGWEKMDGERALKYVRSRNAEGEEGTDAARAARQQTFLSSFKNQLLDWRVLLNPKKITRLIDIFFQYVSTNLAKEEYPKLILSFLRFNPKEIKQEVLLNIDGLLFHPAKHYSGQWVLLPKEGNWERIQKEVSKIMP